MFATQQKLKRARKSVDEEFEAPNYGRYLSDTQMATGLQFTLKTPIKLLKKHVHHRKKKEEKKRPISK